MPLRRPRRAADAKGWQIMRIVVSGSTGLVGSALCAALGSRGCSITRLVRPNTGFKAPMGTCSEWDPCAGQIDSDVLNGAHAVINLCGENIADGRWTTAKKKRILESRTTTTATLARAMVGLIDPPRVWLNASAMGIYGDRGDAFVDESSPSGSGFLAETCRRWEAAARPAIDAGQRVAFMRLGMVLTARGGALAKMLPLFRWGLGAKIGSGEQYWPWISMPDCIGAMLHLGDLPDASGPYNFVAPEPTTNARFTRALSRVLHRPALLSVPEQLASLMTGEMAEYALLGSQRAGPRRLLECGYTFEHPTLIEALAAVLD
jgi:hypothetical protein